MLFIELAAPDWMEKHEEYNFYFQNKMYLLIEFNLY